MSASRTADFEDSFDRIVLDCGSGISPNVVRFVVVADDILLITTPEPTSIANAFATLKVLLRRSKEADIHLLVNMAESDSEGGETPV